MLKEISRELDRWIDRENQSAQKEGFKSIQKVDLVIVGQTALIEYGLNIPIAATMDVDVYKELEYSVRKKLQELLSDRGKTLDPVGHEAWMPSETQYHAIYTGPWVTTRIARPEFVMLSKALKAPTKNHGLIIDYIASEPPEIFFELAAQYGINLDGFME